LAIPVSNSYIIAEAATSRAQMAFCLSMRKTSLSGGTSGTKNNIDISGNTFSLSAGATRGSWVSASKNTSHPVKDTLFRLFWDQITGEGEVAVYLRSATVGSELGDVAWANASQFSNSVLSHYRHKKWCQTKVKLTRPEAASDTPQVSTITIEGRALVPNSEVIVYPNVQYSVGKDFLGITASQMRVGVDNQDRKWDELYSQSYVYNRNYLNDQIDLYAGLKLGSGKYEYLPIFSGKIDQLELDSAAKLASLSVRGNLLDNLNNIIVGGKDIISGLPQPYGAGRRYRDLLVETNSASRIWTYFLKQSPTTINNVYTRNVENNLWRTMTAASYTASPLGKKITFNADADIQGDVAIDVSINGNRHPVVILKDILNNEVSVKYNASQLTRIETDYPDFAVGIKFEEISGFEAISRLARILDIAVYEAADKLNFVSLQNMLPSTHTISQDYKEEMRLTRSKLKIANKYSLPYGNYWDDRTKVVASSDSKSIASFGIRDLSVVYGGEYTYTFDDPISCNDSGAIINLVTKLKLRLPAQKETVFLDDVFTKTLRMELGDKAVVNNAFFGYSNKLVAIYERGLDLKTRIADLGAMGYDLYSIFIFAPTANSQLASYWMPYPEPPSSPEHITNAAYFF